MAEKIEREKTRKIVQDYYEASRDSEKRLERVQRSITNVAAFNTNFDFSSKVDGQSCEVLPKVTTAVESFSAFIKKGLTQQGDWYSVDMTDDNVLSPEDVKNIIDEMISRMPDGAHGTKSIFQVISDGAKAGSLYSLIIFKVRGVLRKEQYPPGLAVDMKPRWNLCIDLTPFEDYYPDPTGRKLYEIHEKKVDMFEVVKMAKSGVYDKDAVESIKSVSGSYEQDYKDDLDRDESEANIPHERKTVVVREFYGTLVDNNGVLIGENVRATVANDNTVIQDASPIKEWCGSPFATGPLTRVPFTVWHRAPMDYVSDLNQSLNELYNLIFDAGISAVHGVKELRLDWLEDPASVAGGIAPQQTIAINSAAPAGASALTISRSGAIPGETLALLSLLEKEILEAAMTNELRLGSTPEKKVLATEILTSEQNNAVLLDSVLSEYEEVISVALTKSWQLIVENMPNIDAGLMIRAVGEEKAARLASMKPEERYARYVKDSRVIVKGLSALRTRSSELRKLIGVLSTAKSDPLLMQEYGKRINGGKLFERLFSMAGVDLRSIERDKEEIESIEAQLQQAIPAQQQGPAGPEAVQPAFAGALG